MLQISNSISYNKSILRKLNPSFKFMLFIFMVFLIFIPMGFLGQIILFVVIFTMFILAKLSKATYLNMFKTYVIMGAMFLLINWITIKSPTGIYLDANGFSSIGDFTNFDSLMWNSSNQYTNPNIFISTIYGGNIVGLIPQAHYESFGAQNQNLINQWINRIDSNDLNNALNLLRQNTIVDESHLKTILYMLNNDYKFNDEIFNVIRINNLPSDWVVNNLVCNMQGSIVYQSTIATIGPEAIFKSFHLTNKVMFIILLSTILTSTTTPSELTNGIEKIFKPLKMIGFPAQQSALILSIGIRFIPSLLQESRRILNAQAARGLDYYNGNVLNKIKALVSLIIPLFTISIKKSEDLANAMDARAYNPRGVRTQYQVQKVNYYDYIYLFIILLISSFLFFLWINKLFIGAFGMMEFILLY